MMKKTAAAVFACMAAVFVAVQVQAANIIAWRTSSDVLINDSDFGFTSYNINDNNYFKLRDLSAALSGTSSNFDVVWNEAENRIELTTGVDYSGEVGNSDNMAYDVAYPTDSALVIDGQTVDIEAYNINDNNYYKLRDLGEVIPFEVYWSEEENTVCVYTELGEKAVLSESSGGSMRYMTQSSSQRNWQYPLRSYIYKDGDSLIVADISGDEDTGYVINADTYDSGTYRFIGSHTVEAELPIFGGFYAGEKYNYIAFGQENPEEDDNKEVIRIVKYDKDFNRISSASVTDCFTVIPFDAGCPKMCESADGSELVLHTSRERYLTEDGLHHQSQLTIVLNTDTMTVENDLGEFQTNHVSHSFNQFVLYDGNSHVLLDHGDAYPRAVVMNKSDGSGGYDEAILFEIPGETGDNYTGVTVGGFAAGENNYIAAINTVDHENSEKPGFSMMTSGDEERDVVILTSEKDNIGNVGQVYLTDYAGNGKCAGLPYLVDLENGYFMVLWQEFETSIYASGNGTLKYAVIDENGNISGEIHSEPNMRLSRDCQPVVNGGEVVWYVNSVMGRMFYRLDISV